MFLIVKINDEVTVNREYPLGNTTTTTNRELEVKSDKEHNFGTVTSTALSAPEQQKQQQQHQQTKQLGTPSLRPLPLTWSESA